MPQSTGYDLVNSVLGASSALVRESHRFFRPLGLSEAQFNILNLLSDQPQGLSQRELSEALLVDRSNITGLVDRMEKAGWVRRSDDPADRRVYRVSMTSSGTKLFNRVMPLYLAAIAQVTDRLGEEKMRGAIALLGQLSTNARTWNAAAEEK